MPFNTIRQNSASRWAGRAKIWETNLLALARARIFRRPKFRKSLLHCAIIATQAHEEVDQFAKRSLQISTTDFNVNLSMLTNEACVYLFRFGHKELKDIVNLTAWPITQTATSVNGYAVNPTLATCVVLRRLATANRWYELEGLFGKFSSQLAEIFREALKKFMDAQRHLVTSPIPPAYLADRATTFSEKVLEKSDALDDVIAFIDGTVIGVSRPGGPGINQRVLYNEHKRKHAMKYQAITTPDGLFVHLFGPEVDRRHDMYLYAATETDLLLQDVTIVDGKQYLVYGDAGYTRRVYLEFPFEGANLTAMKKAFNKAMSKVRVTVEWYFKEVKLLWSMVDSKRSLRIRQAPVGLMYRAAVLLTTFATALSPIRSLSSLTPLHLRSMNTSIRVPSMKTSRGTINY